MNEVLTHAISAVIQYLGATPVLLFLAVVLVGPMISVVWVVYKLVRSDSARRAEREADRAERERTMTEIFARQDKRFEQVVRMYEDNVELVKNYEKHVDDRREVNNRLIDLVTISTATQQQLVETSRSSAKAIMHMIENNEFCPFSRVKSKRAPGTSQEAGE